MSGRPQSKNFLKALGPGILWAGAAVGVSHLVQSTRAGASYGLGLLGLVIIANIFKYPAFSFGPRYAAATGTSLLEGYRRQGRWALILYTLLTLGTMFTIQAVVTVVTAGLGVALLGWSDPSAVGTTIRLLPSADLFADPGSIMFMVALVGWMPSAFDISIWHSLWTLARRHETEYTPTVKESLLDFNIGYLGTVILALCFVALGAGVMFNAGKTFPESAGGFAAQVIGLYTENLGPWSKPLITLSAFTVMFSTTLTVIDGFPRAIATLVFRFKEAEMPDHPPAISDKIYWVSLIVLAVGSIGIIGFLLKSLTPLVDLATILSFLTAPMLAWLNHRVILSDEMPSEHRPGKGMIAYSWAGIVFSTVFAVYFLWVRLTS
jgi:Mn2+/Fe2+ NRAMP family transporter